MNCYLNYGHLQDALSHTIEQFGLLHLKTR